MLADWAVWIVSMLFGTGSYWWLVRRYPAQFRRENFLGVSIPAGAGTSLLLSCDAAYVWLLRSRPDTDLMSVQAAMVVVLGFGILGLADDLYGDRSIGGLRGHLNALIRGKRLTTGAAKAIGGALLSLVAGWILHPTNILLAAVTASLIALSANAINLTDTRPGRAMSVTLAFAVLGCLLGWRGISLTNYLVFVPPLAAAFIFLRYDRRAMLMMGDVGANVLGGLVGLLWAVLAPLPAQIVLLLLLIWFHVWTEKNSLSKTIEATPWLRKIDLKIGLRS
jgi:UDP-GlcNAc:undecaprenyl-phosphate/decaprenyl-phosphate GlcNAc-1-phosphate transferase